jgi:capsular exopolysaccharide synthesis family protein
MGKITEALKKVTDERISRIQKKPEMQYVVRKVENTDIDEHIVSFHDPTSPVGEQYKILRTNIQSLNQTKGYKTFAITSSIHREGKTVTAINLAMTMAHDLNNKSILLIDADLRKCKVAKYLGLSASPGLSEVLKGDVPAGDTFISPGVNNLTIMPGGKGPRNPSELLGSKRMERLIASLGNRFDYIFIDTPPVMPLTDACIIGPLVDGVIVVIQAGRTQREVINHAESRLYQAQAKTLGYIMTNVEYHLPQYLYRYIHEYSDYAYNDELVEVGK